MVVVLPDSVAQIRAVLAYCYEHDVKVVPRAGTCSVAMRACMHICSRGSIKPWT
jgi:FAD/FMN-containing dehydrogenase